MEQLSVTTAMVGLMAVSSNIIELLADLNTAPMGDTITMNATILELKQYRSSIHVLYKTLSQLETSNTPFPERRRWINVDDLIATLTDTVLALSELQLICEEIDAVEQDEQGNDDSGPLRRQTEGKVKSLCSLIRWHNVAVGMVTTVLKCPGEADAQTSRKGLEQRMTRLLSSNAKLSGRLRDLQDVFNARGQTQRASEETSNASLGSSSPQTVSSAISCTPAFSSPPQHPIDDVIRPSPSPPPAGVSPVWSPFTGYTLADLPVLSSVAIPMVTTEVQDGFAFYTSAFAQQFKMGGNDSTPGREQVTEVRLQKPKVRTVSPPRSGKKWLSLSNPIKKLNRKKKEKKHAAEVAPV